MFPIKTLRVSRGTNVQQKHGKQTDDEVWTGYCEGFGSAPSLRAGSERQILASSKKSGNWATAGSGRILGCC